MCLVSARVRRTGSCMSDKRSKTASSPSTAVNPSGSVSYRGAKATVAPKLTHGETIEYKGEALPCWYT